MPMFSLEYWSEINVWSVKIILIKGFLGRLGTCTLVFCWQKKLFELIFFSIFYQSLLKLAYLHGNLKYAVPNVLEH